MNYGQGGGGYPPSPPGNTQVGYPAQDPYAQAQNPYGQPAQDPYAQGQNPYGQPAYGGGFQQAPKKSNLGLILGIVGGVLAFGFIIFIVLLGFVFRAASTVARSTPTTTSTSVSNTSTTTDNTEMTLPFLERVAHEASRNLPKMLDSETREESVTASPGTLTYHNRLINKSVSQLSVPVFTQVLKPSIVANDCSNSAVRDSLLLKGVTLRYSYVDRNGSFIASVDITKHDCGI